MDDLTRNEKLVFKKLSSPVKIQDFLDTLKINFEKSGDTLRSPREVLRLKEAHCIEAALFAAAAIKFHGGRAILLDLKADASDYDHVVALYTRDNKFGAISKSNHASLRFRDPVYRTLRELALSYFHEYFDNASGKKTLVSYSRPFDLGRYDDSWITAAENLWDIGADLDDSPHYSLVDLKTKKILRKADAMERKAGNLTEWKPK